ncbi:hypothetical protein CERZMDRAFT_120594 [Cercospora zeae-maydis SCOH1-5]|uniref:Uncharacterized protein n=1 Tax=Cercospora zeae-maydis SCOH1-5 TaxID=717836 RepID=A0A6A6FMJ7_9PEZI|nr:hypothetical protein CERZMDRAFT_120594 [Cercospora zeae-maydis SCOH1-5]
MCLPCLRSGRSHDHVDSFLVTHVRRTSKEWILCRVTRLGRRALHARGCRLYEEWQGSLLGGVQPDERLIAIISASLVR